MSKERTNISAIVIADSISPMGNRLTTMVCTYPKIIHSEFMTHRMFSRNSASSRAIPFKKMVESVKDNPFVPIAWQKDHKGMQGTEYHTNDVTIETLNRLWKEAAQDCCAKAAELQEWDVTKQICNRQLEAYMWHTVIVTASEWENFYALRCPQFIDSWGKVYRSYKDYHKGCGYTNDYKTFPILDQLLINKGQAEIHMMALAEAMWDAYKESIPKELKEGDWHIPFEDKIDEFHKGRTDYLTAELVDENYIKLSTVMYARVSYTTVGEDQKPLTYKRMIEIHDDLLKANPKHMSPFEHCARVMTKEEYQSNVRGEADIHSLLRIQSLHNIPRGAYPYESLTMKKDYSEGWSGNFKGFIAYRKMIEGENITV